MEKTTNLKIINPVSLESGNFHTKGADRKVIDNKIENLQARMKSMIHLAFEKAIAHHENPSMYPLPADNKSVETAFSNFLGSLSGMKRNKVIDKINETFKAGSNTRSQLYKDLVNVNFKSTVPIAGQVKSMPLPDEMKINIKEAEYIRNEFAAKYKIPVKKGYTASQPAQAVSSNKVSFFVDNMTCLNPDDVLKDEINLAGFAVDAFGSSFELAPFFVGKFRKNETVLLGGNNRLFTLDIDPDVVTQTFTAGLFIVESDLISNEDTVRKLTQLFLAIGVAIAVVLLALIAVTIFVAPVITPLIAYFMVTLSVTFQAIGLQIIPLLGDDISLAVTDTLSFDGRIDVGTTFDRTLQIGKGFDINSTFDGKYTAAARWVGEL